MPATLYVETTPLLHMPGTASFAWREEFGRALDAGRSWIDGFQIVLVGRNELDALTHAALHEWNADRVVFGSNRRLGFLDAVGDDLHDHSTEHAYLLSATMREKLTPTMVDRLAKMRLHRRVRVLPYREDVVTPVVGDDLIEVLNTYRRKDSR